MTSASQSFFLAFSALFSIVNPLGTALIFSQVTAARSHAERAALSRRIAAYSAMVMLGALWGGAHILSFFGVSLSALRIAGGLVVTSRAWCLLQTPEQNEVRKQEQASESEGCDDVAFYPLTMPFTAGPGTIAVAIAIGSNLPVGQPGFGTFFVGASTAALAVATVVWISYTSADKLVALLGSSRARVIARLSAFLLLCVGTQITISGVSDVLRPLLATAN
jgi:multiple antibiotic resistance protein